MIIFKDIENMTNDEYFNGNKFSVDAFNKKYKTYDTETYVQSIKRVCDFIASVEETKELQEYWSNKWFDEIFNDWWQPAGSIMQGAGSNRKISLANCTTVSAGIVDENNNWDNLESIFKNSAYTIAKSAAYRQGLGIDASTLRPRDSLVLNSANKSTGAIHWLKFFDSIGYYVGQEGRIPAMLFSMNISHPDIEEFISIKKDYTQIQNANISVQMTNDFYEAVNNNKNWELKFTVPGVKKGDHIYLDVHSTDADCIMDSKGKWYKIATHDKKEEIIHKTVNAKKILKLIAKNMYNNAEPGIQNIDIARKYSNSDAVYDKDNTYDSRILSTNACSEQYLSRESLCVLSSINMEKFNTEYDTYINELKTISYSVNRFLDNVNECELKYKTYATPHQKLAIESLRRTGAGITNIGGWLFKLNKEYGESSSNVDVERFIKMYNYYLYKSSISLGKEKGSFGLFNKHKLLKAPFISNMINHFPDLEFDYLRNVTVSSIAPTGCTIKETKVTLYDPISGTYFNKTIENIFTENNIDIDNLEATHEKQWFDLKNPLYVKNIDNTFEKITKLYYNGYDVVKKIEFENNISFTGTHTTHKILVKSKEKNGYGIWKTLDTINENDEIIIENTG